MIPELRAALKPRELSSSWNSAPVTPEPTASPVYVSKRTAASAAFDTMKKSSDGEDVYWLQRSSRNLGYYKGAFATGTYLDGTVKAVKAFQKDHGFTADGIAGVQTLNAIMRMILATAAPDFRDTPTRLGYPVSHTGTVTSSVKSNLKIHIQHCKYFLHSGVYVILCIGLRTETQ